MIYHLIKIQKKKIYPAESFYPDSALGFFEEGSLYKETFSHSSGDLIFNRESNFSKNKKINPTNTTAHTLSQNQKEKLSFPDSSV